MRKRYNTPHRSRVVKTRLTDEEYADFTARLAPYGMSQSEFIRQAITRATIRPIVTVSPVNDELLAAVGKLTAEYGRIGGILNQFRVVFTEKLSHGVVRYCTGVYDTREEAQQAAAALKQKGIGYLIKEFEFSH